MKAGAFHASPYLTSCRACGGNTTRVYSRAHDGKCKACAEPQGRAETVYGANNARVLECGWSAYAREEGHYE